MGEHFAFGGGASQTSIHPVVLIAVLLAAVSVLLSPRKYVFPSVALVAFLTPVGEQIFVGGFHFFVMRILVLFGGLRIVLQRGPKQPGSRRTKLETTFCLWAFFRAVTGVLLYRAAGALAGQMAFWLDAFGAFFLFRFLLRDEDDILYAVRSLAFIAVVLAACMSYESVSGVNVFNSIRLTGITPLTRNGHVRAQAVFANSICAGCFGATLLPLFFWLWWCARAKVWGIAGLIASTTIVLTSAASTPFSAFLGALLALGLWPLRERMRLVRWSIVLAVLGVALVMKAPVWYLLAKVDFVGGHGWDRAYLVDQFVRHVSDWWLVGTTENANWGNDTWDQCNQFVAEGELGGLISLVFFLRILSSGFGAIGRARKAVAGALARERFLWCLGAALFAHVVTFLGLDYFDQLRIWWFAFLAMIPAATLVCKPDGALLAPLETPSGSWSGPVRNPPDAEEPDKFSWFADEDAGFLEDTASPRPPGPERSRARFSL